MKHNKNFVFIPCEYFIRRLIKFSFYFIQMNISFQTNGKLLNYYSPSIYTHTPYESDKKVIVKASAKKKIRFKMVYVPHMCTFEFRKKKKRKKKRESFCLLGPIHARINSSNEFTRECRVNHSFEVLRACITYDFQQRRVL